MRQPESNNQGNRVAKPVGQDETIRLYHQHLQVDVCDVSLRCFLASQDAQEVMRVTYWVTNLLTNLLSVGIDFTDVTLVSEDTYRRLHWCDPDDHNDHDDHGDHDNHDDDHDEYIFWKRIFRECIFWKCIF